MPSTDGAQRRARVPRRPRRLSTDAELWAYVREGLRQDWPPEEISRRLVREYAQDMAKRVSA